MKTLIIARHAKSDWNSGCTDFDRPLNERGLIEAPIMALRLKDINIIPNIIFTSKANRTKQTAEIYSEILGISKIEYIDSLYTGTERDYKNFIKLIPDNIQTAMIVGHNPSVTDLLNTMCDACIICIDAAGVSIIENEANTWIDIFKNTGKLIKYFSPKTENQQNNER